MVDGHRATEVRGHDEGVDHLVVQLADLRLETEDLTLGHLALTVREVHARQVRQQLGDRPQSVVDLDTQGVDGVTHGVADVAGAEVGTQLLQGVGIGPILIRHVSSSHGRMMFLYYIRKANNCKFIQLVQRLAFCVCGYACASS